MTGVSFSNAWSAWAHNRVLGWLLITLSAAGGAGAFAPEGQAAKPPETERHAARVATLRAEIARHDELYFKHAQPEISDAAYDQLRRELARLEAENAATGGAPSGAFPPGDDRTPGFSVAPHRQRMLSLDKAHNLTELRAFHARVAARLAARPPRFVVEPKYDGLAVSLVYERGRFVRAVTRGNGGEGDDITANVRALTELPVALTTSDGAAPPEFVELRGELFVTFAEFARVNREREAAGEPPFTHPRSLAAGTAKLTDPASSTVRRLELALFAIGGFQPAALRPESHQELRRQLHAWGLPGVSAQSIADSRAELERAVEHWRHARASLPFPTDGAVVKLDSLEDCETLGESATAPRWAIAFKFEPARATTRVRAITLQVGRSGRVTPVAELDAVRLGDVRVARATLHNPAQIARLDVRPHDLVILERAGDVIPAIVEVDRARRAPTSPPYSFPDRCPACAATLETDAERSEVRCPNFNCPAQVQRRIEYFASANGVGIDGLGPALIARLYERGRLRSPADLYRLGRDELLELPRVGPAQADALLAALARSRNAPPSRVLVALSLPGVGPASARRLAEKFPTPAGLARAEPAQLESSLGSAAAAELASYLRKPEVQELLREMQGILDPPPR